MEFLNLTPAEKKSPNSIPPLETAERFLRDDMNPKIGDIYPVLLEISYFLLRYI